MKRKITELDRAFPLLFKALAVESTVQAERASMA